MLGCLSIFKNLVFLVFILSRSFCQVADSSQSTENISVSPSLSYINELLKMPERDLSLYVGKLDLDQLEALFQQIVKIDSIRIEDLKKVEQIWKVFCDKFQLLAKKAITGFYSYDVSKIPHELMSLPYASIFYLKYADEMPLNKGIRKDAEYKIAVLIKANFDKILDISGGGIFVSFLKSNVGIRIKREIVEICLSTENEWNELIKSTKDVGSADVKEACSQISYDILKSVYMDHGLKITGKSLGDLLLSNIIFTQEKLNSLLPLFYEDSVESFSRYIFSDLPAPNKPLEGFLDEDNKNDIAYKVIYNLNGYAPDTQKFHADQDAIKGSPVQLEPKELMRDTLDPSRTIEVEKGAPIGYNIYLPEGDVKAVFVEVYGGHRVAEGDAIRKGAELTPLRRSLLNQGIAVITLNLINLRELLDEFLAMPQNIHDRLHGSIHKFFQVLKDTPELLDPALVFLRDKRIYLFGQSFGGRTAIRHAELYPGTFDGYISQNGWISIEKSQLCHRVNTRWCEDQKKYNAYLSPTTDEPIKDSKIALIHEPVLLLHSLDDINVNIKETLEWFKRARKTGKSSLVKLFIINEGSKIRDRGFDPFKGHGMPSDKKEFNNYLTPIVQFVLNESPITPQLSEDLARQYRVYAHKYDKSASIDESFISEAYRIYKTRENMNRSLGAEGSEQQINSDWVDYYHPLYYHLFTLNTVDLMKQVQDLNESGKLTEIAMKNALKNQFPLFIKYLKEIGFQIASDIDIDKLSENQQLHDCYRNMLLTNNYDIIDYKPFRFVLLENFYEGNLTTFPVPEAPLAGEEGVKEKLIRKIQKIEGH